MLANQENALIEALKTHRDCKRLLKAPGALPKVPQAKLLTRYTADAPTLYVVPGTFRVMDGLIYPKFTIAALVRNVAGNAQARKGDGITLGIDHLLTLAVRALHEQRHGDCLWRVTGGELVDDEEGVFEKAGLTAMEITLEGSGIELPADYGLEELDDFLLAHADFDIDPHAGEVEYASWLQTPPNYTTSRPDAVLDVQLEGAS